MSSNTAPIKWAQRSDSLYVTIALQDVTDEKIALTDTSLIFVGKSGGKDYAVNIEFYQPVNSEGSTYKVLPRSIQMLVMKKTNDDGDDDEFWPRLLKDKSLEKNQVKIDWDRYVDEDEEEEEGGFDTGNLAGGQGMPGMPGMGGMDPSNMDMEALMKQMGGMGGMGKEGLGGLNTAGSPDFLDKNDDDDSDDMPGLDDNPDDDDDDMPALE